MTKIKDIPCRAKNPATCPYHGAQLRAETALIHGDQNAYLQAQEDIARAATSHERISEIENYFQDKFQKRKELHEHNTHRELPRPGTHAIPLAKTPKFGDPQQDDATEIKPFIPYQPKGYWTTTDDHGNIDGEYATEEEAIANGPGQYAHFVETDDEDDEETPTPQAFAAAVQRYNTEAYLAATKPKDTKPVAAMSLRKGDIISLDGEAPKEITGIATKDGYNYRINYINKGDRNGIEQSTQLWGTTPVARYSPIHKMNLDRFVVAYQNAADDTYDGSKTIEENIDTGYQHLLDVYTNEIRNKKEAKILRDNPEEVKDAFRWYMTANIDDPTDD